MNSLHMSNKKFSRSKKTEGSNVPNFVFKIGGDAPATTSFNFTGSQPGSPLASPGGFGLSSNPSSPASASFNFGSATLPASSHPFVFGDPLAVSAASPTTNNNAFNFGASLSVASTTNSPLGTKRVQSDLAPLHGPERGSLRRTDSETFLFPTTTNSPFGTKRVQSDLAPFNGPERGSFRRNDPEISFSFPTTTATTTSATATQQTSAFAFETTAASPAAAPSPGGFIFGSNATNNPTPVATQSSFGSIGSQSSVISFSTPGLSTTLAPVTSSGGGITFGSPALSTNPPPATSTTSSTSAFSFGSPAKPATTTPAAMSASAFSFGSSVASSNPPPTTSSTSAITTPAAILTLASAFSFGSPASSTAAKPTTSSATSEPSFKLGTNTTTDKPTTPAANRASFSISIPPAGSTTAPSTLTSAFSFGKPAETPKISTSTTSNAPRTKTAPPFSFGAPAITTSKPLDDKPATTTTIAAGSTGTSKPTTSASTSKATTPSFSFSSSATSTAASEPTATSTPAATSTIATTTASGATTSAPVSAPSASLFSLGTADKDDKKTGASFTPAPFTFSIGNANSTISTTTPATSSSIPAIDPNKPNPFSFSKILDDLAKIAAQPPSQMYASLITPAYAALQQNQIVNHTNFRIDNISSSTRFTELPEQAQKELDELEKYVRLEGQRSEYIGNHKLPQHFNIMTKEKKDTELLSQNLDALSNTLKGQMQYIESFYENAKIQLRDAKEGSAVIEACKHPGNNARWLFGYSEDDDYFSLLVKQLSGRLEEYKKCIWEIERTTESWTHNRVQSPQDIADIMRTQNQAFLALSNKVAALHESVGVEMNNYNQYLKMYA